MDNVLRVYNTHTRKKEAFQAIRPPYVGIYLCGPTVYGEPHLGHARSAIVFDVIRSYLKYLGYKVKYVRNITDVGHLEWDRDEGVDKIAKRAALEQSAPMEVVQRYTYSYRDAMAQLGVNRPDIEPCATGHLPEQIKLIEELLAKGFAYTANGSVYFSVAAYQKVFTYGELSGKQLADLQHGTRRLVAQQDKRDPLDFAVWKKADKHHIMRWESPWGVGFPGWHLACTVMGATYLGKPFDIHGGGMDLCFPHHECELAQAQAAYGVQLAKYWLHHNFVTVEAKKMSRSLTNFITLAQCFAGTHPSFTQPYEPMVLRLFMLQTHYRHSLGVDDVALQHAQQMYYKLLNGLRILDTHTPLSTTHPGDKAIEGELTDTCQACHKAMQDDFNTPQLLTHLLELRKLISKLRDQSYKLSKDAYKLLRDTYTTFVKAILGLKPRPTTSTDALLKLLLTCYTSARSRQDYDQVDALRRALKKQGIDVQDTARGADWHYAIRSASDIHP